MRKIIARRTPNGVSVTVSGPEGSLTKLDPRYDLANHSPDGFEWGYAGSGPAQLSLAMLALALDDDEEALEKYHAFKDVIVAHLPKEGWTFEVSDVVVTLNLMEIASRSSWDEGDLEVLE